MMSILAKNMDYQQQVAHWTARCGALLPPAQSWARGARWLAVALLAIALAQLTWRLVPAKPQALSLLAAPAKGRSEAAAPSAASQLTELHLFGISQALPGSAINAPETSLNLSLRGIIAIDSRRALAIIASGSEEQPYKVGDSLPGGATLHEIVPEKVILERGGRFETLTLPRQSLEGGDAAPSSAAVQSSARLSDIRERIKANPAEVVGMNAIQPVMENGQLKGYQLGENPYSPALRSAGMMPGDVVTRVNGIPVTDQARAAEMLGQLSSAGRIDIELERGGAPMSLSVDLNK